jgi:hypothetical protein
MIRNCCVCSSYPDALPLSGSGVVPSVRTGLQLLFTVLPLGPQLSL